MKKNYWRLIVVVIIVFVAGLMVSNMLVQAKEKTPVIQWEYKTVKINYMSEKYTKTTRRILEKDLSMLNGHGKDGWELCGVNNVNYYFKRVIKEK
jgi:uncharacterized protein YxeA